MLNFKVVSNIFSNFLDNQIGVVEYKEKLNHLIWLNIKVNQELWSLEDSARMVEFGSDHVATAKKEIDKSNQIRNNLIREMDAEIVDQVGVLPGSEKQFYSESPGMIIDRLAIMFIKLSVIRDLLSMINEEDLKAEYLENENIILRQIEHIGSFLDRYFDKLARKEVFFEIQQPIKIYNDTRVKEYIKLSRQSQKGKLP